MQYTYFQPAKEFQLNIFAVSVYVAAVLALANMSHLCCIVLSGCVVSCHGN